MVTHANRGYSLIELLIVVTLVAILSLAATSFLFTSLRGTGQASGLAVIKQNGDHTIGVIERSVRGATSVSCPSIDSLTVTDASGLDKTYAITNDGITDRVTSTTSGGDVYLTSDQIIAENFSCTRISGAEGQPDIISVSFQLRFGDPSVDRPEDVAIESFEARVGLRTY